ncbi:MAG: hypothetical protein U0M60_06685, partial [Clostridia bacterium]|nr:hypothetical protein [Clostridia bacterium]
KGGYIAKILDCKEESRNGYSWLAISFDIAEGEHKGHFAEQYRANTNENKKWRGTYNAFIPDESSQYYEDNLNKFKTMIANIEESNPGYHWDWDETKLKGKLVGVIFGEKEFETESNGIIIITECRGLRSVECIKENKFKMPALKKLSGTMSVSSANSSAAPFTAVEDVDDDDLPF